MLRNWRGAEAERIAREAGLGALRQGAEVLLTEAQNEAPVETGTLRRSGTVTEATDRVYVSFNTPYAVRQHEELEWRHPLGGKAKYLEDPFKRMRDKIKRAVQLATKKALRERR
jgi:hypothetical protein